MSNTSAALTTPAEAVLAAPFMLGYWPEDSLCAVFVDPDLRVTLLMRWDADADAEPVPLPPLATGGALPHAVHLIAYTRSATADGPVLAPDRSTWMHVERALLASGVTLGWILVARRHGDDVLWTCVEGSAAELAVRAISAAQIVRQGHQWGLRPWVATRSAYVGDIAQDADACQDVARELGRRSAVVEESRDAAISTVRHLIAAHDDSHGQIAEVLVALADVRVRDTILWEFMHEDPATWPETAERMARMVRVAPDSHVASPATLLAVLRWQIGDGSRAAAAVERALAADPTYTLAALVDRCLATGMHPSVWRAGLSDLTREDCRRAA